MNTRILAVLGIGTVLLAVGTAIAAERTVTLAVDNMYCSACPYTVKQSLAKVTGVDEAASAPRMPPAAANPALPIDGATSLRLGGAERLVSMACSPLLWASSR